MEIAPNIFRFDTGPFNWYLIREAGRLTLVDAGFPGHYRTFIEGIHKLGHEVKDVEAIILTHSHADHTGFAESLRRQINVPVFIHEADRDAIGRALQLPWLGLLSNGWRPYVAGILGHAIFNGVFTMPHITKAYTFRDGDVLSVPGKPVVIHVPGHTRGEVAFHLPESKILFSGDTVITQDLLTGVQGHPQLPNRILNSNDAEARQSLDRIRELGPVTLLPGHGKPWTGTMEEAIMMARGNALAR
jgi:glyoxylase-like metal-dependent hydrolase (beta-lactamase superfamily II)